MKKRRNLFWTVCVSNLALCVCLGNFVADAVAAEKTVLQETLVTNLGDLSVAEAFDKLKTGEFVFDDALLGTGVREAFLEREDAAIELALKILRKPHVQLGEGKNNNSADDFRVAKQIFRQFKNESLFKLETEYNSADAALRSNIIQMLGSIDLDRGCEQLLIEALDDRGFCEGGSPEEDAIPLRVCDVAYNQLVLAWQAKDVLRTIGVIHKLDVRDYHIQILKDKIADYRRI